MFSAETTIVIGKWNITKEVLKLSDHLRGGPHSTFLMMQCFIESFLILNNANFVPVFERKTYHSCCILAMFLKENMIHLLRWVEVSPVIFLLIVQNIIQTCVYPMTKCLPVFLVIQQPLWQHYSGAIYQAGWQTWLISFHSIVSFNPHNYWHTMLTSDFRTWLFE